jgi:hypothetical protein
MQRLKPPRALVKCTPAALKQHLSQAEPIPVLLPGLIAHYRALKAWTIHDELNRFKQVVPAEREVDVEIGPKRRGYLDPQHARVPMGFGASNRPGHTQCSLFRTVSRRVHTRKDPFDFRRRATNRLLSPIRLVRLGAFS